MTRNFLRTETLFKKEKKARAPSHYAPSSASLPRRYTLCTIFHFPFFFLHTSHFFFHPSLLQQIFANVNILMIFIKLAFFSSHNVRYCRKKINCFSFFLQLARIYWSQEQRVRKREREKCTQLVDWFLSSIIDSGCGCGTPRPSTPLYRVYAVISFRCGRQIGWQCFNHLFCRPPSGFFLVNIYIRSTVCLYFNSTPARSKKICEL